MRKSIRFLITGVLVLFLLGCREEVNGDKSLVINDFCLEYPELVEDVQGDEFSFRITLSNKSEVDRAFVVQRGPNTQFGYKISNYEGDIEFEIESTVILNLEPVVVLGPGEMIVYTVVVSRLREDSQLFGFDLVDGTYQLDTIIELLEVDLNLLEVKDDVYKVTENSDFDYFESLSFPISMFFEYS